MISAANTYKYKHKETKADHKMWSVVVMVSKDCLILWLEVATNSRKEKWR